LILVVSHHTTIYSKSPVFLFDPADESIQIVVRNDNVGFTFNDFGIFNPVDDGLGETIHLAKNAKPASYVWGTKFRLRKNQVQAVVFPQKVNSEGQCRLNILVIL
jgi:hypothetical protein